MLTLGNLNGPLPAPNSVPTWAENVKAGPVKALNQSGSSMSLTMSENQRRAVIGGDPNTANSKDSQMTQKDTSKVMDLAVRLEELLVQNDNASALEKLPREVFVVDVKRRDAAIAVNKARAAQVREEIEEEDAGRDLISARILAVCEGGMEVKAKEVHAMKLEHCIVPNLPIPKLPKYDPKFVLLFFGCVVLFINCFRLLWIQAINGTVVSAFFHPLP